MYGETYLDDDDDDDDDDKNDCMITILGLALL